MLILEEVKYENIDKLDYLLQLYLSDISKYFKIEFDNDLCRYKYDRLDKYFDNSNNYAYILKDNNNICGFILVDSYESYMTIQEIFILNNYRKSGYAKKAVNQVFNQFKSKWIIKVLPCSNIAENFWLKVIKQYTNNNYKLEYTGKYNRAEFTFENK